MLCAKMNLKNIRTISGRHLQISGGRLGADRDTDSNIDTDADKDSAKSKLTGDGLV